MFQPYSRVVAGELPIYLGMNLFSARLPCVNFAAHLFNGVEPAIQDERDITQTSASATFSELP